MTTLAIDIRKAEPRDAEAIADVHRDAWQGAYAGIIPHRALTAMINRRGASGGPTPSAAPPRCWSSRSAARSPAMRRSAATAPANCRSRARSTSSTCGRNIRASGWAAGCSPRRARGSQSHGLNGLVVWALEENDNALAFYAGAGGRDIAEGVEVFDQKAMRKVAFVWD